MKVLILFTLFSALIYKFYPTSSDLEADTVKVNMSAVRRQVLKAPLNRSPAIEKPVVKNELVEVPKPEVSKARPEVHDEEAELGSIAGWNSEVKDFLTNVEPIDGEDMYTGYISEREKFQSEFNNLSSERTNLYTDDEGKTSKSLFKANKDQIAELNYLIDQLTIKHQERLKDILGAHYEQVQEMETEYNNSLESGESQEESDVLTE